MTSLTPRVKKFLETFEEQNKTQAFENEIQSVSGVSTGSWLPSTSTEQLPFMSDAVIKSICLHWPAGEEQQFITLGWDQLAEPNSNFQLHSLSVPPDGGAGALLGGPSAATLPHKSSEDVCQ